VYGLHPYRGKIRHSHYKSCGCALYLLESQYIPHTWPGHFFKVAFIRDEDDCYKMQLHVKSGDMLTGARDMYHFNLGARNEEWYQPRIKRLFDIRPAVLVQRGCCISQRRTRMGCDSAEFLAQICLLAPRILEYPTTPTGRYSKSLGSAVRIRSRTCAGDGV